MFSCDVLGCLHEEACKTQVFVRSAMIYRQVGLSNFTPKCARACVVKDQPVAESVSPGCRVSASLSLERQLQPAGVGRARVCG